MSSSSAEPDRPDAAPDRSLLLLAIFALPTLVSLIERLAAGGWLFNDLDAVLCGAWRAAHGASPYAEVVACPGGRPAAYVYLPQLARLLAPLAQGPDISGLRLIFGPLIMATAAALAWMVFARPAPGVSRLWRAPLLGLSSGGAIASGNLAYPGHLLIVSVASLRRGGPWPLIVAIALVSVLKPIFLTYLLIFAYLPGHLLTRAWRIAAGLLLAALAIGIVLTTAGPDLAGWRAAIGDVALSPSQLGFGFFVWTYLVGVEPTTPIGLAAYGAFVSVICLAGLVICEAKRLDARSRILLAMGVAQLVNPRIMKYDMLMLAPLAVAYQATPATSRRAFHYMILLMGVLAGLVQLRYDQGFFRIEPLLLTLMLLAAAILVGREAWRSRGMSVAAGQRLADVSTIS